MPKKIPKSAVKTEAPSDPQTPPAVVPASLPEAIPSPAQTQTDPTLQTTEQTVEPPVPAPVVESSATSSDGTAETKPTQTTPSSELPSSPESNTELSAPPTPGWLKRLFSYWFNPDTKLGRFNRSALRWVAAAIGLFALGMLAVYLMLYLPALDQLRAYNAALTRNQDALRQTQVDLLESRQKITQLEEALQTARSEQVQLQNRLALQQWLNQTNAARAAVARREGPAALTALRESRALADMLYPVIKARNPAQADALKALVELAQADLARDSRLVQEDLDRLLVELTALDAQFAAKP